MDFFDYVPKHDMSKHMKTMKLLESGYLLANDNIAAYIDVVRPRIFGIYAFNKFGRLHNLIFDTNAMGQDSGLWGIMPSYSINGETCFPFYHDANLRGKESYHSYKPSDIIFDQEGNSLKMNGIKMYNKNRVICPSIDYSIQLKDDRIIINVKFPDNVDCKKVHLPWYPLYDKYKTDETEHPVEYYNIGSEGEYFPYFKRNTGKSVILRDSTCRQAGLGIETKDGSIELVSCTVPEIGNVLKLNTDVLCTGDAVEIEMEILENPIVIKGNPYYYFSDKVNLDVDFNNKEITKEVLCNFPVNDGQIKVGESHKTGENRIELRYKDDLTKYDFYTMSCPKEKIIKMADACLKFLWKDGKMKGIVPQSFDLETLTPLKRSGYAYISHGMRIIPIINAAATVTEDITYSEKAYEIIKRVIAISNKGEDNSLFTPIYFDDEAAPCLTDASRPSDQGIIIKGLLYCADSFCHFERRDIARECICDAYSYFKTIQKMQCEDGSFWSRYHYPSAEPNTDSGEIKGTVNNWCMQLWNLAQMIQKLEMDGEDNSISVHEIIGVIEKFIDWQLARSPSILEVCGGGEDPANYGDALNTASTYFTMKYMLTKNEIYKDYAQQAVYMAWLKSSFYADMPQYFSIYGGSDLGEWYNQPNGIPSFGGMCCLTSIEANLFAYSNLGIEISLDIAKYFYAARMATFVKDNGGVYMVVFYTPNYFHREEILSEALMYGGVGVFSYYLINGMKKVPESQH